MNCLSLNEYKTLRVLFAFCTFYFLEVGLHICYWAKDGLEPVSSCLHLHLNPRPPPSTTPLLAPPPPKHWDYRRGSPNLPNGKRWRITVREHPTFLRHILFVPNHLGPTLEIAFWLNSTSFECQRCHFVLSVGSEFFGWYCKDCWAKCVKLDNEQNKAP